jgi:hypothetical protein
MVAIVILFISMMAILWALSMSVQHNMQNLMMDEAVKIANERMNVLRSAGFAALATNNAGVTTARTFRNSIITYTVTWNVQNLSSNNSRAVQVLVTWSWQNIVHRHAISSVVSTDI